MSFFGSGPAEKIKKWTRQASGDLIIDDLTKSLAWDEPPLCLFDPRQQVQFKK